MNYELKLLCHNGVYPYEYVDSHERFNETVLTRKVAFHSQLQACEAEPESEPWSRGAVEPWSRGAVEPLFFGGAGAGAGAGKISQLTALLYF